MQFDDADMSSDHQSNIIIEAGNRLSTTKDLIDFQLTEIGEQGLTDQISVVKLDNYLWNFSMKYGDQKIRTGEVRFTENFPVEPPVIQFHKKLVHPYVDGTRYILDLEKWSKHNLSMNGLLIDVYE